MMTLPVDSSISEVRADTGCMAFPDVRADTGCMRFPMGGQTWGCFAYPDVRADTGVCPYSGRFSYTSRRLIKL